MSRNFVLILVDILVGLLAGLVAAATVIPISMLAFVIWLIVVTFTTRSCLKRNDVRFATVGVACATLALGSVVTAAALYQPAKVTVQLLQREIKLPSTRMTLAELAYLTTYDRTTMPVHTDFCFAEADKNIRIEWPRQNLTLEDFLAAIESQTTLRRRFMHCGNGYTVLGGGDCCFGLYVRDPELAIPPFARERFDVDAYAALRNGGVRPETEGDKL